MGILETRTYSFIHSLAFQHIVSLPSVDWWPEWTSVTNRGRNVTSSKRMAHWIDVSSGHLQPSVVNFTRETTRPLLFMTMSAIASKYEANIKRDECRVCYICDLLNFFFDLQCFVLCFAFGNRFMCFYYASTIFQFSFRLRHCEMCVRWTQSIECRIGRRFVLELTGRRYETTSALRIIFVSMKMSGILPNSSFDPHKCWPFAKFFRFDSFVYNFPFVTSHRRVLMAAMIVWPDIRYLQSIFISSKW